MTLDKNGLSSVQIVASDSSFEPISSDILNSSSLSDAVSIIGLVNLSIHVRTYMKMYNFHIRTIDTIPHITYIT